MKKYKSLFDSFGEQTYNGIRDWVQQLFSSMHIQGFPEELRNYFRLPENLIMNRKADRAWGRRKMFIQRYKHLRSLQQSRPGTLEHISTVLPNTWTDILNSHYTGTQTGYCRATFEMTGDWQQEVWTQEQPVLVLPRRAWEQTWLQGSALLPLLLRLCRLDMAVAWSRAV